MLAIIGGTGIYALEGLEQVAEHPLQTPFGPPSAAILQGRLGGRELLFLPRHGCGHQLLPGEVNYRANIWALKSLGATQLVGLSAVGSLREELAPGQLVIPDQYFDFVKGPRVKSFFGQGLVAHVSTAEPTCPVLSNALQQASSMNDLQVAAGATYACVDGPRLGTRAESLFLRNAAGCDLVGMTNVPEAFLAREAQLCYATVGIVTDYDCWRDNPADYVSVEQVIRRYGESLARAKRLLSAFIAQPDTGTDAGCNCRHSLAQAVLSDRQRLTPDQTALLEVLGR